MSVSWRFVAVLRFGSALPEADFFLLLIGVGE
jgi:hypothetical protein